MLSGQKWLKIMNNSHLLNVNFLTLFKVSNFMNFIYYIEPCEFWNLTSTVDVWTTSKVNLYDMVCKTTMVKNVTLVSPNFIL